MFPGDWVSRGGYEAVGEMLGVAAAADRAIVLAAVQALSAPGTAASTTTSFDAPAARHA